MEVLHRTVSRRLSLLLDSKSLQHLQVVLSKLQLVDLDITSFQEKIFSLQSLKLKPLGLIITLLKPVLTTLRDLRASLSLQSLTPIAMSRTLEEVLARMRSLPRTSKRS
jgi:hypothetical protein